MPNVYFAGLFAVLILAGLGGSYLKGRTDGGDIVRGEYAARDLKAASDYAAKERSITEANRQKERQWAKSAASASARYQRELATNETQRLADRAAIESGAIRLRDPGTDHKAAGSEACPVAGSPSGHHGAEGTYLSSKTTAFLLGLATEADSVVNQLSACQQVLRSERQ